MCLLCEAGFDQPQSYRAQVLQLLALVEHPDALPRDAALCIARRILELTASNESVYRCEPVDMPSVQANGGIERRRS